MNVEYYQREDMFSVLMYLLQNHLQEDCAIKFSKQTITSELRKIGFKNTAIKKALSWLEELAIQRNAMQSSHPHQSSLHIFSNDEIRKIPKDCRGLLLRLEKLQILNSTTRELVISLVMDLDVKRISPGIIKFTTLIVIFNEPNQRDMLGYMEYLILEDHLES